MNKRGRYLAILIISLIILTISITSVSASIYYYPDTENQRHYETITTFDRSSSWENTNTKTIQRTSSYNTNEIISISNDWYRPAGWHCSRITNDYDDNYRSYEEDYWRYHYRDYRWEGDYYDRWDDSCYYSGSCYRSYRQSGYRSGTFRCWYG